ncbi:MAG TPA: 4'-phosphopantetheinyl transferase superfamily protein [bacterium]|nr:4'-phosphopantetheinyl transferase superfamily protein [bacterium]
MRMKLLERSMAFSMRSGEVQLWLLEPRSVLAMAQQSEALLGQDAGLAAGPNISPERVGQRCALRMLLSQYTGRPAAELKMAWGPHGKPSLAADQPGPRFSVSGSGGWVLAAFSQEEVGVDLECEREDLAQEAVAERHFSEDEMAWWQAQVGPAERRRAFLKIWTRKEALLKLRGVGLAGLDALRDQPATGSAWMEDLPLTPFLVGCVALHRAPSFLRFRRWSGEEEL